MADQIVYHIAFCKKLCLAVYISFNNFVETVFRDAHQSLLATRMSTEQMLPIVEKMDRVGYHAVECWGGATFDTALRFLKEDPWVRLRRLREGFKHTKLQMLLRGQNLLGYSHYSDDVVDYFCRKSVANGIDNIRIMDCLNDIRNLRTAMKGTQAEGGRAIVALVYTLGEAYTLDYWRDVARRIEDMGADELGIKDMAGLLTPYRAEELVRALKDTVGIPVAVHTHYTAGVASMTYLKAVEAGCDSIDCAISPLALGTSQPATEVIVGTQAVLNVISGERYKITTKESKRLLLGEFGQTVKEPDPEVKRKITGGQAGITCRPADRILPQLPQFEKECARWKQQEEDVLTYAMFPAVAKEYFQYREAQQTKVDMSVADTVNGAYPV
ncbi:MAG: hypothetical protein HFG66_05955 [Hungatella sp.]|nr:hypothetical protein [Hungatella sp.]